MQMDGNVCTTVHHVRFILADSVGVGYFIFFLTYELSLSNQQHRAHSPARRMNNHLLLKKIYIQSLLHCVNEEQDSLVLAARVPAHFSRGVAN